MKRQALKTATAISAFLLAMGALLFLAGYRFNAWDYQLSVGRGFHIGVWSRGLDSRIVFFNDAEYGPYSGSVIGLVADDGNVYPPRKRELAFGDDCGVYFRYFEWFDATTLWTVMVSLWYPIVGFAILPAVRLLRQFAKSPKKVVAPDRSNV